MRQCAKDILFQSDRGANMFSENEDSNYCYQFNCTNTISRRASDLCKESVYMAPILCYICTYGCEVYICPICGGKDFVYQPWRCCWPCDGEQTTCTLIAQVALLGGFNKAFWQAVPIPFGSPPVEGPTLAPVAVTDAPEIAFPLIAPVTVTFSPTKPMPTFLAASSKTTRLLGLLAWRWWESPNSSKQTLLLWQPLAWICIFTFYLCFGIVGSLLTRSQLPSTSWFIHSYLVIRYVYTIWSVFSI